MTLEEIILITLALMHWHCEGMEATMLKLQELKH